MLGRRWLPRTAVALLVGLQAGALWHELTITRYDLNDNVFHVALVADAAEALRRGENPTTVWVPEWSLGYPVLRTYQPLAHLMVAGLDVAGGGAVDLETLFSWVRYLLLCLWPLTVFVSARLLGLSPWTAVAAAALAPLVATEGLFGLELGSYLWRGSGLFTQSLAMHLLALTLGFGGRALRSGRALVPSGFALGLTFLAHFIYGYIAGLSLALLALIEAPRPRRLLRMALVGLIALVVATPVLIPLLLDAPMINRSVWEPSWKWDSLGMSEVASKLIRGELLDAGRFPSLTLLALAGAAAVGWRLRTSRTPSGAFLLAGAGLWLALFCGRPTWGLSLRWLGLGELTHLHRLIGGAHFFLILLAAVGLGGLWAALGRHGREGRILAAVGTALLLWPAWTERVAYLEQNRTWGMANVAAHRAEEAELETILALASDTPGRVFPGFGGGWGKDFRIGSVPVSAWLSRQRIPSLAYLYHSMAMSGDVMVHFDERRRDHFRLFNVSAVLAPSDRTVAPFLERGPRSGRIRMWQAPESGYFEVVAVDYAVEIDRSSFYEVNRRWLAGAGPRQRRHLRLDFVNDDDFDSVDDSPRLGVADPIPSMADEASLGSVEWQEHLGKIYRAHVRVSAPAYLLFKMTYHRNWRATVDGQQRPTVMLSPGFVGVALEPGGHEVELRYRPEPWRTPSVFVCLAVLLVAGWVERRGRFQTRRAD